MSRCSVLLVCALLVSGCRSGSWGPYSSPRVSGQVLAADTREPLPGVNVSRGGPERRPQAGYPPKGGELMMRKTPVRTDQNGQFVLDSERVLSVYRGTGWDHVRLRFVKAGYLPLQTNLSLTLMTNAPAGEASLVIGQVFLQPTPK
jgi:hypothetical protein